MAVPKYDELFNPVLSALHTLGGSGRIDEIDEKTADILKLSEQDTNQIHKGNTTVFSYRAAWARNYLKRVGLLENSDRGVWSLTPLGLKIQSVSVDEVKKVVKNQVKKASTKLDEDDALEQHGMSWRDELLEIVKNIKPDAFERLC